MTLGEAIDKLDTLKPNSYTPSEKIRWLSALDGIILRDVILTHEGYEPFEGMDTDYNDDTPLETELLVPSPYEDIYLHWLESKVDFYNAEYVRYNNSITRYNDCFTNFSNNYNRNHMPLGTKFKYF